MSTKSSSSVQPPVRSGRLARLVLCAAASTFLFGAFGASASWAGSLGNANFRHGFHVNVAPNSVGDELSGKIGADTIRIHTYWSEYQTGVNQYSEAWLQGIVNRVQVARQNTSNKNIKALVQFDLPGKAETWMQEAGYQLVDPSQTGQARRYYPTSGAGLEAYGKAMAMALKYLYNAGVAEFIETPNEPNQTFGVSDPVSAIKIGQMAGQAVSYAAAEGLQLNSSTGPAILVGALLAGSGENYSGPPGETYAGKTDAEYFGTLQWWTDFTIEQWWKNIPGGPSFAVTLKGTWRPSFHSYPNNGPVEASSCQAVSGTKLQDQEGDLTGAAAYGRVIKKLEPLVNQITSLKKWWITETGMSSFKTNKPSESFEECLHRREEGGSSYGRTEQSNFYKEFVTNVNYMLTHANAPWSRFEGATFFQPTDISWGQFAGYGVYWSSLKCGFENGYRCPKAAAETFHNYYGSEQPVAPPPWNFINQGGNITEDPDISSWGPGRIDIWGRAPDGSYAHKAWISAYGWLGWENLASPGTIVSGVGSVGVGGWRLDALGRNASNEVVDWWWNGAAWQLQNFGGNIVGDPDMSSAEGNYDIWARSPSGSLMRKHWTGSSWSSWQDMGVAIASSPGSTSWGANRIDVVARASNNTVTDTWWNGSIWQTSNLGGNIVGAPDIASWGPNRLDVFGRGTDNSLMHKWYDPEHGWSNWESLGGWLASSPGAGSWGVGRVDVVARSFDNQVLHWWLGG